MESTSTVEGTVIINGGEPVRAVMVRRQEMIEYRSNIATKADPGWEFTDAAGHFHAYDEKGKPPTLDTRVEQIECDGSCGDSGCEGYTHTHYHCALCAEEIEPGRVPDHYGFTPGRWSFDLTVHAQVPSGRVSFRFTGRGQEWFGFAEAASHRMESFGRDIRVETEMACWPVGQRKARASATVGG